VSPIRMIVHLTLAVSTIAFCVSVRQPTARAQQSASPVTVRFGSVGGATDAPLYLAEEFGYFTNVGLKVERRRMTNAPTLMAAIATNQIDVAGIAVTAGLFAAVKRGINLRIVGDKQSLRPGFSATRAVIRSDLAKDTEGENVLALRGRTVAVSDVAGTHHMLLEKLLNKYGMSLSDVRVVQIALSNMVPALKTRAIDGAFLLEPFLSDAVQADTVKVISDLTEFAPKEGGILVPVVYSEKFAAEATETAKAFMKAYMRGVRVYNDAFVKGKDKQKIIEIIARYANIDPKIISDGFPAGFDPNQRVSIPFLGEFQTFFFAKGFLDASIDLGRIVDMSFADAAVKELGPYK
jgi:NitT/TauT family transport system substrate-binding protein